ncbi:MAG: NAD(P)H-dependent oxidoreductase [bacterium]|nr:NAD(P)H-dependent oxidoreductase [bacterium]
MPKVLIIYSSRSGNTKKLAEAVISGVKEVVGVECELKGVSEVSNGDLVAADGIIIGSPVYFGSMSAEVKEMFDKSVAIRRRLEGKIGAAFATSGHHTGGKETTIFSILQAMLIHGMLIVGDPISAGGHYGVAAVGSPDTDGINSGKALGKRVAEITKRLFC